MARTSFSVLGSLCAGGTDCAQYSHLQGAVEPKAAAEIAAKLHDMGCYEVSMGDTIGVGTPASVSAMFRVGLPFPPSYDSLPHTSQCVLWWPT